MEVKSKVKLFDHQLKYVNNLNGSIAFVGGYGCGKTYSSTLRVMNLIKKRVKQKIQPKIMIMSLTYDILKKVNIQEFVSFLNKYKIKYTYNRNDNMIKLLNKKFNKAFIYFTSSQKPENIVALTLTDVIIDEIDVLPKKIAELLFKKVVGRLRGCEDPTIALSSTPEGINSHLYKLIYEDKKINHIITVESYKNLYSPIKFLWSMVYIYGVNAPKDVPNKLLERYNDRFKKPKKYYKRFDYYLKKHSSPLLQQYFQAKFVNIVGDVAIYGFDRKKNVVKSVGNYHLKNRIIYIGIDFNVDPFTISIATPVRWDHDGLVSKIRFIDEIHIENKCNNAITVKKTYTEIIIEALLNKYPNEFYARKQETYNVNDQYYSISAYADMSGRIGLGKRQTSASLTDIQIIKTYGISIIGSRNPLVKDRLASTNMAFLNEKVEVCEKCKYLIRDFEKVEVLKNGDINKKSDSSLTHMLDGASYMIHSLFKLNKPAKWKTS